MTRAHEINDIALLKGEMRRQVASNPRAAEVKRRMLGYIILGVMLITLILLLRIGTRPTLFIGVWVATIVLLGLLLIIINNKWANKEIKLITLTLSHLAGFYHRWLELAARQAQMQETEAQRAYQQALERAKQQLWDCVQQLRPIILDYTTLADQTSPPWQGEAWQKWASGILTPGVVRLGVFTLHLDQPKAK